MSRSLASQMYMYVQPIGTILLPAYSVVQNNVRL